MLVQAHAIDREAFTFTNYNLDVRIEPEQQRLAVRGKITLRNDSASPQKILALQISSSLDWRSIQLDGKPAQFVSQPYTSDIDHTGALSEALVTLPKAIPPKGTVELEIGYEGIDSSGCHPADANRRARRTWPGTATGTRSTSRSPPCAASDMWPGIRWQPSRQILSEGNSVFETVARWKARELQAQMKIKLSHSGEGTPATLLCNGEAGGLRSSEQMGRAYESVNECDFQPLGETVPLFVIGPYEGLDQPPVNISYLPDHKPAAQTYALAAQLGGPIRDRVVWSAERTSRSRKRKLWS